MVRLQFNIPDYLGALGWDTGANLRRQIVLTLANAHVKAVEEEAKAKAPSESGRLRASINARLLSERLGALEVTVPYARYLHHGTGVHGPRRRPIVIESKEKKALSWPGAKHPVKRVRQRGIKPNDFLRMAMAQSRAEARVRLLMKTLAMDRAANSNSSWYNYWNWTEFFDDVMQRSADFSAGFGDTISSVFGLTGLIGRNLFDTHSWDQGLSGWARLQMDTDEYIDRHSGCYTGGTVAADVWLMALSGSIGSRSFIRRAGTESSHWIPSRFIRETSKFYKPWLGNSRLGRWFVNSSLNRTFVSRKWHYYTDPYRWLSKEWNETHNKLKPIWQQLGRVPAWMYGSFGLGVGVYDMGDNLVRDYTSDEEGQK